jgi:hypothetical protein
MASRRGPGTRFIADVDWHQLDEESRRKPTGAGASAAAQLAAFRRACVAEVAALDGTEAIPLTREDQLDRNRGMMSARRKVGR